VVGLRPADRPSRTTPWADAASIAHQTLHWLAHHGRAALVRRTVIVVNNSDGNADDNTLSAVAHSFVSTGCRVFAVPFDHRLRPGAVVDLHRGMSASTAQAFLGIAAALARQFGDNASRHPRRW